MSNCKGCFHERNDEPDAVAQECEICIRNPKYPTKMMPERVLINGIEMTVPQDMYISRDRKTYEEKLKNRREAELIELLRKASEEKTPQYPKPYEPWVPVEPWTPYPEHYPKIRWETTCKVETSGDEKKEDSE